MKIKQITAEYLEYGTPDELGADDRRLVEAAIAALASSYSPYSMFRVGAAALLADGTVMPGSNQENVAFPSALCAERVALFSCGAQHPGKQILALAVVAESANFSLATPVTPCGACRQVISEYESMQDQPIRILMHRPGGATWVFPGIDALLPLRFQEIKLKK